MVACEQTSLYMEENSLLPKSQYGFRSRISTMTALTEVQKQWANNTENKEITGILMWDLSAAFDWLYINILCVIMGKSHFQSQTFINYAAKIWNEAPRAVKDCTSLHQAKNQIKISIKTLPI